MGGIPILTWILLFVAGLILLTSTIWTLVLAFKRGLAWGMAFLFSYALSFGSNLMTPEARLHYVLVLLALSLAQLALYLTFLVVDWAEAKQPFLWSLSTIPLFLIAFYLWASSNPDGFADALQKRGVHFSYQDHLPFPAAARRPSTGPSPGRRPPGPVDPTQPGRIQPGEVFRSKISPDSRPQGEPDLAPPGVYYLLQRVTAQNATGFRAANVGEKAILMDRLPGDKMRVMVDVTEFIVHKSQITNDLRSARQAEREDFVMRGGQL